MPPCTMPQGIPGASSPWRIKEWAPSVLAASKAVSPPVRIKRLRREGAEGVENARAIAAVVTDPQHLNGARVTCDRRFQAGVSSRDDRIRQRAMCARGCVRRRAAAHGGSAGQRGWREPVRGRQIPQTGGRETFPRREPRLPDPTCVELSHKSTGLAVWSAATSSSGRETRAMRLLLLGGKRLAMSTSVRWPVAS